MITKQEAAKIVAERKALEDNFGSSATAYVLKYIEPKIQEACQRGKSSVQLNNEQPASVAAAQPLLTSLGYKVTLVGHPAVAGPAQGILIEW